LSSSSRARYFDKDKIFCKAMRYQNRCTAIYEAAATH
jgi:hypothetical protein